MGLVSTTPLLATAIWESGWQSSKISGYAAHRILVVVFADQVGTIHIEQGSDGSHGDVDSSFEIKASDGEGFNETIVSEYWRIRYVNGAVNQTVFRISCKAQV